MKPGDLVTGMTFLWESPYDYEEVKFQRVTSHSDCYLVIEVVESTNPSGEIWAKVLHNGSTGWGFMLDMEMVRKK